MVDVPPVEEDPDDDTVRQASGEKFYDSGVYDQYEDKARQDKEDSEEQKKPVVQRKRKKRSSQEQPLPPVEAPEKPEKPQTLEPIDEYWRRWEQHNNYDYKQQYKRVKGCNGNHYGKVLYSNA